MYAVERLFENPEESGVLVCAEIGINHMASLDKAREMVVKAQQCGADAVKFQVFQADRFYNPGLSPEGYNIFKSLELPYSAFLELKKLCDSLDLLFYATPFDFDSLNFLIDIGSRIIKIASSDITCEPLLEKIAEKSAIAHYVSILSTGFVGLDKIRQAVKLFKSRPLALQYCVSKYPADSSDFDLNFIKTLQNQFFLPIGFSDHSMGNYLSISAVSLGAKIIERHFTTDRNIPGADHAVSLDPEMFTSLVRGIREIESAMGSGTKKITDFEKKITQPSMRDIYAARPIKKGEILTEEDIILLRPGNGVKLSQYRSLIGRKASKDFKIHEKISSSH